MGASALGQCDGRLLVFFRSEAPQNAARGPVVARDATTHQNSRTRAARATRLHKHSAPAPLNAARLRRARRVCRRRRRAFLLLLRRRRPPPPPPPRHSSTTTASARASRTTTFAMDFRRRGHRWARRHRRPPLLLRPARPGARGGRRREPCTS